ncbi:MAG: type II toxin-antitoxin system VapC family toxin [Patescibacteria group bacterium]|nr:type II toxin-antitoxin system VapC family toxin [Patescibacteria group bacterium]
MANYYLETSAFLKRYKQEKGSAFVNQIIEDSSSVILYLNLTLVEVNRVLFCLYKYPQAIGEVQPISKDVFDSLIAQFGDDLLKMKKIVLTEEIIKETREILEKRYLKSLDLLHLATFLIVKKEFLDVKLISADRNIIEVAKTFVPENDIINPETYE